MFQIKVKRSGEARSNSRFLTVVFVRTVMLLAEWKSSSRSFWCAGGGEAQGGRGRRGYCWEIQVLISCTHVASLVNSTVANSSHSAVTLPEFEIQAPSFTKLDVG